MQGLIDIFKPERTFRPQRKFTRDSKRGLLFEKAQATLGLQLCMSDMVVVPPGEDKYEWIAVHAVDFFNRISLIFGTLTDACLSSSCPAMSHSNGSKRWDWKWQDNVRYKKPTRLPAPEYIFELMNWVERELNDDELFPLSSAEPWPRDFMRRIQRIFTRLHRVFVHVYYSHFRRIQEIAGEAQVNYCYKHFWFFVNAHALIPQSELEPLADLASRICRKRKDYPDNIPPGLIPSTPPKAHKSSLFGYKKS